jgi:hypothetical protein
MQKWIHRPAHGGPADRACNSRRRPARRRFVAAARRTTSQSLHLARIVTQPVGVRMDALLRTRYEILLRIYPHTMSVRVPRHARSAAVNRFARSSTQPPIWLLT